jgi:hypothetical protein
VRCRWVGAGGRVLCAVGPWGPADTRQTETPTGTRAPTTTHPLTQAAGGPARSSVEARAPRRAPRSRSRVARCVDLCGQGLGTLLGTRHLTPRHDARETRPRGAARRGVRSGRVAYRVPRAPRPPPRRGPGRRTGAPGTVRSRLSSPPSGPPRKRQRLLSLFC